MAEGTNKVVIKVKPKEYLRQGLRYCGGYTIKAILSAYGFDDGRHPRKYLPSLKRSFGFTTPQVISKVLKKYGIESSIKRVNHLKDEGKLQRLKKELKRGHPVILLVGNGYSPERKYSWWRQQFVSHWISLWGYNDKEKVFYVYDSYVNPKYYDNIPIGNIKRTYNQLLRDWRGTLYTCFKSFLYIQIIENVVLK